MNGETKIEKQANILKIIWMSLTASVVIYFGLGFVIPPTGAVDEPTLKLLTLALGLVSATTICVGLVLQKVMLDRERIKKRAGVDEAGRINPNGADLAIGYWITINIISWAIIESAAINGLLLFILGGSINLLGLFCFASLLGMIISAPKTEPIISALAQEF